MVIGSWGHISQYCEENNISEEDLVIIYDAVFDINHSPGFKRSEVMGILCDEEYTFMDQPRENWKINLKTVLEKYNLTTKKDFNL